MTEKLDKYILDVQIDNETGEEHCTVLKTDETTDMNNWITIINAMYTHHSILEPLVNELNKIYNGYSDTEKYAINLWKENEQLKMDRFICLDCEHSGYVEIGCLCEYNDHWQEHINECEDFKELKE